VWGIELVDLKNERLEFDFIYKGLNVVHSEMWLEFDESTTIFNWTVATKPVAQFLFRVNNYYQVTVDSSGTLLQSTKKIDQKNIQQEWVVDYDWNFLQAQSNQNYAWPFVERCTHILSMLYDMRTRPFALGDTLTYLLDIESQIWNIKGVVQSLQIDGNFDTHEIVFHFSPALDIVERVWKTDIVTNRIGRDNSTLTVQLGPAPERKPLLIRFGSDDAQIEMRLKSQ
jgi:hypothetical protein